MPRFSMKDLLLATTLIALGLGVLAWSNHYQDTTKLEQPQPIALVSYFACRALIGAGLFAPFKRPWLGAVVGVVGTILVVAVMIFFGLH
jgi:hypothetical protein